jgi:hypothetical protein
LNPRKERKMRMKLNRSCYWNIRININFAI